MNTPHPGQLPAVRSLGVEIVTAYQHQMARFGTQPLPDLAGPADVQEESRDMFGEWAVDYREINEGRFDPRDPDKRRDWTGILLEQVYGSLAEADPAQIRAGLVRVMAVAAGWIHDIDRRAAGGPR
jgi:hypothetical protein